MWSTFKEAPIHHFCFNISLLSWDLSSFFLFGYNLIFSFLNSLLKVFKKHLSLNAILGHYFFAHPTIFLQFFLVALGTYYDALVVFSFGNLFFHRFRFKMYKCPLLYTNPIILISLYQDIILRVVKFYCAQKRDTAVNF